MNNFPLQIKANIVKLYKRKLLRQALYGKKRDLTVSRSERKKNKRAGNDVFSAVAGLLGMVLIIGAMIVILILFTPKLLGYATYDVISGSMEPVIPVGSLVLVKEADPKEIEEGDIIAFSSKDDRDVVITHRVMENDKENEFFITKGDANDRQDKDPASYDRLVGRVVRHFPKMGSMMADLSSFEGKLLLMCVLSAGVLLNYLSGRLKE